MTSTYSVKITVTDRRDLDKQLDIAVDKAVQHALRRPESGVLITRHDNQNMTVQLSTEVPFGTILERDLRLSRKTTPHSKSNS